MQCERARELISGAIDGELDGAEKSRLSAHLAQCRACAGIAQDFKRMGREIASLGHIRAPAELKGRILHDLAEAERREGGRSLRIWRRPKVSALARYAAVIAISALVASGLTAWMVHSSEVLEQVRRDIVSAHVRSLLQDSPIQVASSDTHTVKPWFAGRIDISPVVRDLAAEGFQLIGGRLDYIDGRRAGVLVYKQRQHVINVFTLSSASTGSSAPEASLRNGYNLLTWTANGIAYSAISDLNLAELQRLRTLL